MEFIMNNHERMEQSVAQSEGNFWSNENFCDF